jgi:predicted HAD superfamily Cof-like phosphohydrolase
MTNADRLREFHRAVGSPVPTRPRTPDHELLVLRQALIREEFQEVMVAFDELSKAQAAGRDADIAPLIHELTDLLYVTYGTILTCGVDADEVFAEVHRANMCKVSGARRADGKQLKPADWQPADVAGVIARQKSR